MKLSAVALDFDGTISVDDALDPQVRAAIGWLRERGISVILATGRRLDDLRRVVQDVSCFDVVVGENGAVLEFPASGRRVTLGHRPAVRVLDELRRRGVPFEAGECVIEADAGYAPAALQVIRELEQPLILTFNRGRLMILPQAVAKSTGLRQALFALRLSIHNTLGIGDAENDHDLLDACEVGVAVGWGSRALRAVADEVIEGAGPPAVAAYLRRAGSQVRLSAAQMGRRRLHLGTEASGEAVSLAVRGRSILVAGEPGTGKSYLAGLLCEQLILQGYCLCIIDPEGDYRPLESLPGVITLGGEDPPPHARELTRALRHPDASVLIDLSRLSHRRKVEYLQTLLPVLSSHRRSTGLPHKILVDEAHYFLAGPDRDRLIDPQLAGYILVTYRVSQIDPGAAMAPDLVVFVTRESDPAEIDTLLSMCHGRSESGGLPHEVFASLHTTEAALLPGPEEAQGRIRRFQLAPRLTEHVRHRAKYLDMPVEEQHAFVFMLGPRAGPRARTLKQFIRQLEDVPGSCLADHMRRRDFSRWLRDVFRDRPLAARVSALEEQVDDEDVTALTETVGQIIRARYDAVPTE